MTPHNYDVYSSKRTHTRKKTDGSSAGPGSRRSRRRSRTSITKEEEEDEEEEDVGDVWVNELIEPSKKNDMRGTQSSDL